VHCPLYGLWPAGHDETQLGLAAEDVDVRNYPVGQLLESHEILLVARTKFGKHYKHLTILFWSNAQVEQLVKLEDKEAQVTHVLVVADVIEPAGHWVQVDPVRPNPSGQVDTHVFSCRNNDEAQAVQVGYELEFREHCVQFAMLHDWHLNWESAANPAGQVETQVGSVTLLGPGSTVCTV